jgi:hypothetical protein
VLGSSLPTAELGLSGPSAKPARSGARRAAWPSALAATLAYHSAQAVGQFGAYCVPDWQHTGDPRDVVESILASQEFFNDAGGSNLGFATLLYERVLQRAPEADGLAYWTGLMSTLSRRCHARRQRAKSAGARRSCTAGHIATGPVDKLPNWQPAPSIGQIRCTFFYNY